MYKKSSGMFTFKISSFFVLLSITSSVIAQQNKSEYEFIKTIFETEKRAFFEQYMELTDEEENVFWPIFEDYEIDRATFSKKQLIAIQFFVENYETMTEAQANGFINDIFSFNRRELKLKKKYYRLMSNKLSNRKATRFLQIEEYINTKIKLEILKTLPFVNE